MEPHGLQKAPWSAIEKALVELGGVTERKTRKHRSTLVKMPTGFNISLGKNGVADLAGVSGLMRDLVRAKVEPTLFLAKLEGGAWYREPTKVVKLRTYLKANSPKIDDPNSWHEVLTKFQSEEAPVDMATMPTETIPNTDSVRFPYSTSELLDLVGISKELRPKANVRLATQMRKEHGVCKSLIESGEAVKLPSTTRKDSLEYRFTDKAVMVIGEEMLRYYEPKKLEPETPAPVKETTKPTEKRDLSPGESLLAMCKHFGVQPVWDGYTVDHQNTLIRLAKSVG